MFKTLPFLFVLGLIGCAGSDCKPRAPVGISAAHPTSGKPTGLPALREPRALREPLALHELPELEDPVIVTTLNGGEHWHYKGQGSKAVPRDNTGDGWISVVTIEDVKYYWKMERQGSKPVGGVFYSKVWDGDPTQGWTTELSDPTKALPHFSPSPSQWNLDTHTFAQNPYSGLVTFMHSAKPGYLWPEVPNTSSKSETAYQQRATTMTGGKNAASYNRFRTEIVVEPDTSSPWEQVYAQGDNYFGSSNEASLLIASPYALLFWEHKTWGSPDWTGQTFKGRIHRAWCWIWELDDKPNFRRLDGESYVFDPEEARMPDRSTDNGNALWGTANVTLRSGITMNPNDNVLHMVYQAGKPQVRSDGKPANGKVNKSMGFAHVWSDDYGWHWNWDDGNPIFMRQDLPGFVDNGTANRLNSPVILFDVDAITAEFPRGQGWLFFWGNPVDETNKLGTRLWAMRFKL